MKINKKFSILTIAMGVLLSQAAMACPNCAAHKMMEAQQLENNVAKETQNPNKADQLAMNKKNSEEPADTSTNTETMDDDEDTDENFDI
jgi:DNA-directed RNA polymerase subunit M/transcription elongation factor TFIIS